MDGAGAGPSGAPQQQQQRPPFPGPPPAQQAQHPRPPGPGGPYPPGFPGFRPPPGAPPYAPGGPWGFPPHPGGFPGAPPGHAPFVPPPGGPHQHGVGPLGHPGYPGPPSHPGAPPPFGMPPPFPGPPPPFRGPPPGPGPHGFPGSGPAGFSGPPGPWPGFPGPGGPGLAPRPPAGPPPVSAGPPAGPGPGPAAAGAAGAAGDKGGREDSPPPPLPQRSPGSEEEEEVLAAEAAAIEADAHKAATSDAGEQKRLIARAWTAHKSAEGQVYYHNSITGDSSWNVPEGYTGDAEVGEAPVPVAQAQVGGSPWYEVKCSDGRRYFFNHTTHETAWSMPPEVAAIKKQQADEAAKDAAKQRLAAAEQRTAALRQMEAAARAGTAGPGGRGPGGVMPGPGFAGADAFRRMHMQQMMAARQHSGAADVLSKEVRVTRFKQLLLEGGVNAFSLYAKVKAKLDKDERWKLLASEGERRTVFDEFCKNVAAEQKELAAAAARQSVDGFKALLEEALQLERQLHIALLADKLSKQDEVKKQQQDDDEEGQEKQADADADAGAAAADSLAIPGGSALPDPEDIPEGDLELSMEQLERYWSNDERWGAVSAEQREQLFKERFGAHAAAAAARKEERAKQLAVQFRQLLQQLHVTASSSWRGSVKAAVNAAVAHHKKQHSSEAAAADGVGDTMPAAAAAALEETDREQLFRQYVSELSRQEASEHDKVQRQRQRQEAAEARLAEQEAESAARQRKAARSDAVSAYKTLLAEVVRDGSASFQTWQPKLVKDPLGRASNDLLSQDDLSFYFEDHTAGLAKAAAAAMATALNGAMDQHLKPLLPEGHSAAVAASGGAAAAALSRQLPQPLQKYAAADELLSGTLDDRWIRYTEQQRLDAWRAWIDEHVWGKVPVPPPSVNPAAAGAAAAAGPGSSRYPARPPGPPGRGDSSGRPYEQQDARYGSSRSTYDMSRSNGTDRERDRHRDRDRDRDRDRGRDRDDRGSSRRGGRYDEPDYRDDRKRPRR